MLTRQELEDLLVDYMGKMHFAPHERHLFCLVQEEMEWARSWEDWDHRRQRVENLLRGLGNGYQ